MYLEACSVLDFRPGGFCREPYGVLAYLLSQACGEDQGHYRARGTVLWRCLEMILGLTEDVKFHVFERKNSNRLGKTEEIVREDGTERKVTT